MDLDDAIDNEERRLFPALRKALFAIHCHSDSYLLVGEERSLNLRALTSVEDESS